MKGNQINLTLNISDELLDKVLTVLAMSSAPSPLQSAMPILMGMGGATPSAQEKPKEKAFIGFENDKSKAKQ